MLTRIAIVLFLTSTHIAHAAENADQNSGFLSRREAELASPWTTPARDWLLWGGLATLSLAILEDQVVDPAQDETVENKPLGSTSHIGDLMGQMIPNIVYIAGMGAHYWWTRKELSADRAMDMFKSSTYSGITTQILKFVVHEPRPNNSAGHRNYESFPSGHTASAFAFSSTVIAEHGLWPYGILATAMASFTGFSRMNDNKHYIHDVVGGFTIGTSYGFGIAYMRKPEQTNRASRAAAKPSWQVLPAYSEGLKGIIARLEF